jgi:hypothetical protein
MNRIERFTLVIAMIAMADPANAAILTVPAPIAGVGMGAAAAFGFGYRALKRRLGK